MAAATRSLVCLRGVQRVALASHGKGSTRLSCSRRSLTASCPPVGLTLSLDFVPAFSSKATSALRKQVRRFSSQTTSSLGTKAPVDVEQLKGAREAIKELIQSKYCNPILIRLGWHDAGTFDESIKEWPVHGGANGSIRFVPEKGHAANAGLDNAIILLDPVKEKFPNVSYADLFQLASATAIEMAGGPKINMKYGRVDAEGEKSCPKEGNLPSADPPSPADHLRQVFYRMGLNDKDIVALSGAHTLGRSRPERSGFGKPETKYTKDGPGKGGGQSWTVEWLKFDNSYFRDIIERRDEALLVLPTDGVLAEDPEFKKYTELYARDQDAFFKDYAESHKKLSELGSKFDPPEGVKIDDTPEKFSASKYSSGEAATSELSPAMKDKIRAEYLAFGGSPNKPLQSNYFLNIILGISVLAIVTKLAGGF